MKFGGIQSIEQILKAFVEETHKRDAEDRKLSDHLKTFLLSSQPVNEPKGLREAIYFLRWSLDTNTPIDRSCLDDPSPNDSHSESDPFSDDNSDNIPS